MLNITYKQSPQKFKIDKGIHLNKSLKDRESIETEQFFSTIFDSLLKCSNLDMAYKKKKIILLNYSTFVHDMGILNQS